MMNLVKCSVCCKVLIREEADSHVCDPPLKGVKTLVIAWYWIGNNEHGLECIHAYGVNGIAYRLMVKEQKLIPLSDEMLHRYKTEDSGDSVASSGD